MSTRIALGSVALAAWQLLTIASQAAANLPEPVPAPESFVLFSLGVAGLGWWMLRRRK